MNNRFSAIILALSVAVFGVAPQVLADPTHNPPLVCAARASCSTCPQPDGCACGCILVTLDLGATTVWTGQTPVYLRIHSSDESAALSTPAQLKVVMGWSFKAVDGGTTAGGAPQIVRFVQPEGAELVVHFQDGDSVGVPEPNNLGKSLARVQMVDAEGWATTSAPTFYDLYPGDGSVWRFLATGNTNERGALVSFTDPRGRVLTPDDFGVDIVRDVLGNIRQVKTLTRLADVRTLSPTHYAVTVYPLAEEPEQVADTGLYALPEHAPTRVLDVAQGESVKELLVGFQKGTGDMRQYRYVAVNGDWTLYQPSGLVEAQELYFTEDESGAQRLHTIRDETGKLWSRDEYNYVSAYWGYLITNRIEGIPGDATRTTSWSYYTDGPHKDLLCETVEPTGNRILYEYDDKNRVVRESMPLVEEETLYSYEPVDPSDPPLLCDTRPRCVVRKMQDVEIQRTYYVYGTNGVDVVERVGEQGAAYGGTNVLRTVTTYYPVTGAVTDGLVRSVRHEDGTVDDYAYDLANGVWTETVTHVHEQAPDIIPMRTTRSVRVYDTLGHLVDSRTDLCTIGVEDLVPQADWTPIERLQYAYDVDGNEIRREDLAGRLWTAEWAGNCCGKVSETDWQGVTTTYTYDADGFVSVETVLQPNPIEIHHIRDLLGREIATFATNRVASVGTGVLQIEYTPSGFLSAETDLLGNVTRHTFSDNGLTNEVLYPIGTYETTVDDISGRLLSVSGTATVPRTYEYGCNTNGSTWFIRKAGLLNESGPWVKQTTDMLSFPICEEKSGFGGSIITTRFHFDSLGRILSKTTTSRVGTDPDELLSQDLFRYDEIGTLVRHGRDLNGNGQIDLSGPDRVVDYRQSFVIRDGSLWRETSEWQYPNSGDSTAVRVNARRIRLTSLDSCFSVSEFEDIRGVVTKTEVAVDRANGKVTRTTRNPMSDFPAVSVSEFGLSVEAVSPNAITNKTSYDALNRVSVRIDGRGNAVRTTYDAFGRMAEKEDATGARVSFRYDAYGRNTEIIDAVGTTTHIRYDDRNHVIHRRGPDVPVWLEYDTFGRISALSTTRDSVSDIPVDGTPPRPDVTQWLRDTATGLVTNKVYADGNGVCYDYEPDGRPRKRTWGRGVETVWTYGLDGLLSGISYSDATPDVSIVRDRLGRVVSVICEGVSTNRFFYSPEDFSLVREEQDDFWIERLYDECGRDAGYRTNRRNHFLARDATGRLSGILDGPEGTETEYSYYYLPGTSIVSSMESSAGSSWIRMFEAKRNELTTISNYFSGTSVVSFRYQTDPAARRIARQTEWLGQAPRVDSYTHGSFLVESKTEITDAIIDADEWSFMYDGAGNRTAAINWNDGTEFEFVSDGLGRLLSVTNTLTDEVVELAYDADGNRIRTGTQLFEWDAENRLRSVHHIDPVSNQETASITYSYDYLGRMIGTNLVRSDRTSKRTILRFDGWNPIFESVSETNEAPKERDFVWGVDLSNVPDGAGGVGGLLAVELDGDSRFPAFDGNGNIVAYQDKSGQTVAKYLYGIFGESLRSEGHEADSFPFRFSSKWFDAETGLYWYGKRFYDPDVGRWLSRDPIEEHGGANLYRFLNDSPVDTWDYLGMRTSIVNPKEEIDWCITTVSNFLFRNKDRILALNLLFSNKHLAEMESWNRETVLKALNQTNGTCQFTVFCACGQDNPSNECYRETTIGHHKKLEISSDALKNMSITPPDGKDKISGSLITICAGNGTTREMQQALVHELQHVYDHCFGAAFKNEIVACNNGDFICECASALCTEIRAFSIDYPDKSGKQIYDDILTGSIYFDRGYCELAKTKKDYLNLVFRRMKTRCSLKQRLTDKLPDGFEFF